MLEDRVKEGTGIYTLTEAARYARMSPVTLARWFKGSPSCDKVFSTLEDGERVITFLDFIQALAVRNLRVLYKVKLQIIRDAVEKASQKYGIKHPFAHRHTAYVFEGKLWIKSGPEELVELAGDGQKALVPVIEPFMKDVYFDEGSAVANKYQAFKRGEVRIMMDPKHRFGEPLLESSGYTPEALFEAAKTEGSVEAAAKIYGVTPEQVEVCIDYFDYLQAA